MSLVKVNIAQKEMTLPPPPPDARRQGEVLNFVFRSTDRPRIEWRLRVLWNEGIGKLNDDLYRIQMECDGERSMKDDRWKAR